MPSQGWTAGWWLSLMIVLSSTPLFAAELTTASASFDAAKSENWHQWRGPQADGSSTTAQPPLTWSADKNVKWKVEIPGWGKSSPIVWGQQVFLTTAIDTKQKVAGAVAPENQPKRPFDITYPDTLYRYVVLCLDRETGKTLWQQVAIEALPNEGHHGDNSHASASVTTDGERIFVSFGSRGLYCYTLGGELVWKQSLPEVQTRLSFGEGSSPVVHNGVVVLNRDNETQSALLAFDTRTGEKLWEVPREEISAWATPLITEYGGNTLVITNASRKVRANELSTGELLWECAGQVANVTPSPVRYGDNVICMSGYKGSAALSLPLGARGDISGTDQIVWQFSRDTPYIPSPLLYEGQVYFHKLNTSIFTALKADSGEVALETTRLPDVPNVYASPVAAAGRIYVVGRNGTTVVLKPGSTLEVLASNRLDDLMDASPALVGKQLFLRGQQHLYCLEERQ